MATDTSTLDALPIHPRARRRLQAVIAEGRWAPAYLIAGAAGSGMEATAAFLARAILCTGAVAPCGTCLACRKVAEGCHPDLTRFAPAEARRKSGKDGPIDIIRQVIAHLAVRPSEAARQVVLLPGVDQLQPAAANALLKTLEEPPGDAVLILLVRNPSSLLPTIASRCQAIHLPMPGQGPRAAGEGGAPLTPEEERTRARVAAAQVGEAAHLDPERLAEEWQRCGEVWKLLRGGDPGMVVAWVEREVKGRDEALTRWLAVLGLWLRDGLLLAAGRPESALAMPELAHALPPSGRPPVAFFGHAADLLLTAQRQLTANGQAKLVVAELLLALQRDLAAGAEGGYHGRPTRVAVGGAG